VRILHRYLRQEFLSQFLICLMGFTVLGMGKIIFDYNDMFIGCRITPGLMWYLVLNQVPTLFMDVLPAAGLFGVILSLGRLLREKELDVIQTSGAGLFRTVAPILATVGIFCFTAFWWNDWVVPAANYRFQAEMKRLSLQEDLPLLKENVVIKAPQNRFIYLRGVRHDLGEIFGVVIIEAGRSGKWPRIITADRGKLKRGVWELYNGVVHEINQTGAIETELGYEKMELKIANDFTAVIGEEKTPSAMRSGELWKYYELSKRSGINSPVFAVFFHQKFADPLIALVLVFLAVPLTLLTGRNNRWLGLVSCFLIIMLYYTMQVIGRTMGANGVVAPWIAAWAPHLIFLTLGAFLMLFFEQRR